MTNTFITMATTVSNGISFFKPLYYLFGIVMQWLLQLFNDQYFIALIVFTFLTRLVLFPFNIKQQRTMAKTTRLQPKIQKIQKKYANSKDPRDRQKMNEETQALYQREGHNPMNMGCGPMLFQMVFLMGIIGIIYYPIQYILGVDISTYSSEIAEAINFDGRYFQIDLLNNFETYRETLATEFPDLFTSEKIEAISNYASHLTLFGIDMTEIPTWKGGAILLIPIFCLITSFGSSLVSTKIQQKNNAAAAQQASQMRMMMLMMPFFSFYISFQVSAAVGFYWIISNLIAVLQQIVMAKAFPPKKNIAKSMIDGTIERRAREISVKKQK